MTLWRDRPGATSAFVCRGPGCGRTLRDGMVFCVEHWNALPRELRDGIYIGKRRPEKYPDAVKAAMGWLLRKAEQGTPDVK